MKGKSLQEVQQDKYDLLMNTVAWRAGYYRSNPEEFAKDYLNVSLKPSQKIILHEMATCTNSMMCEPRGIGKTFLASLYCCIRAILYPGTKIVIASGTKGQAIEVLTKIETELMNNFDWGSTNLRNEIKDINTGVNKARCSFKNGSWIQCVASNDNARHNRANLLFVDEYRMVDKSILDMVLRRFLTAPRMPGYLKKPEYADLAERNIEMYASSAFYKMHWSYKKLQTYFANMLDDTRKYSIIGLPYMIAIKEGLLSREQVEDEMSEEDFDPIAFSMEMGTLWLGNEGDSFFDYDVINGRRKIKRALFPLEIYKRHNIAIPEPAVGVERILSVDVALMASNKKKNNDAAALSISDLIPTDKNANIFNVQYLETHEGLRTEELALIIMRLFYGFHCTQLALDTNGLGLPVFDSISKNVYDPDYNITYPALSCCNDDDMAARCLVKEAPKLVWSIKGSESFNSQAAVLFRAGLQNGTVNLLVNEFDCDDEISKIRGYKQMTDNEKALLRAPYSQITMAINELTGLTSWVGNDSVTIHVKEPSGGRKDRYSSLSYAYWVANQLMLKKKPKGFEETQSLIDKLANSIKKAKILK